MNCGIRDALTEVTDGLQRDLARVDTLWCEGLHRFGGPFLAGSVFTAVDAFFCPVAFRIQSYGLQLSPLAMSYAQRLLALRSMRHWYESALEEPWRDEAHELDMRRSGEVQMDLRRLPA
jgi:glutathione S-transferase